MGVWRKQGPLSQPTGRDASAPFVNTTAALCSTHLNKLSDTEALSRSILDPHVFQNHLCLRPCPRLNLIGRLPTLTRPSSAHCQPAADGPLSLRLPQWPARQRTSAQVPRRSLKPVDFADVVEQLTREYKTISENPPPYITAHPSESNILEWHYIITGPEDTPYFGGQYWGTLVFPPNYPFAPPAIRMHTPSGRFQPSTRLCLSISDFHPKSFNPAWEVSTILIGLLSFMTSEDLTTGSVSSTAAERRYLAGRSRWWNSTGNGSKSKNNPANKGNVKAGDGGAKFRAEWEDVDKENLEWMKKHKIDPLTGNQLDGENGSSCGPQLGIAPTSGHQAQAVVDAVVQQREAGTGWLSRNKLLVAGALVFTYVLIARLVGGDESH
ncbi:hypothetical protein G7046_g3316 [Stylonectria norvegica]|nr:hypothetical protein G7046_g3316 [Stylonectria norvegica]